MPKTKYYIYGAGGFGRSALPILKETVKDFNSIFFIDDYSNVKYCNKIKVIRPKKLNLNLKNDKIFIAISSIDIRRSIVRKNKLLLKRKHNLISQKSLIFDDFQIGNGNIISPFCTIGSNVKIGNFVHVNLYSYIEHDCVVGNFVTLSPGVKCNGNVIIEDNVFIGSGAIIGNGTSEKPVTIGKGSVIGAGAVVLKNLPKNSKIIALPPKKISYSI